MKPTEEMNTKDNNSENCNGEPGCCEQKKPSVWKKLVFGLLMLAVVVIILFKLLQPPPAKNESCCPTGGKDSAQCASQTNKTDSVKPCCSK